MKMKKIILFFIILCSITSLKLKLKEDVDKVYNPGSTPDVIKSLYNLVKKNPSLDGYSECLDSIKKAPLEKLKDFWTSIGKLCETKNEIIPKSLFMNLGTSVEEKFLIDNQSTSCNSILVDGLSSEDDIKSQAKQKEIRDTLLPFFYYKPGVADWPNDKNIITAFIGPHRYENPDGLFFKHLNQRN